jgi:hypothetical protein
MKLLAEGLEWPLHATISGKIIANEPLSQFFIESSNYKSSVLDLSLAGLSFSAWIH